MADNPPRGTLPTRTMTRASPLQATLDWTRTSIFPSEEDTERASRLRAIMLGTYAVIGVSLLVLIVLEPTSLARRAVTLALVTVLLAGIHEMNRRGRTALASWVFVLGLIAIVTQRAWITGGIYAPVLPFYVIFVLMGGVLLSRLGGIVTAFASIVGAGILVAGQAMGKIAPAPVSSPWGMVVFQAMILGLALVLQWMVGGTLRRMLRRAENEIEERKAAELERARLIHDLGERVKELRLLHTAATATQQTWESHAAFLQHIVLAMPGAWQYPVCTVARISLGDIEVRSPGWRETQWMQSVEFSALGRAGAIAVAYTEEHPQEDEGPFLTEERNLLESVSEMVALHLETLRSREELEHLVETRTAELSESLARLQSLETLRDNLVHMIVHDIRNLLTVVLAHLHVAKDDITGDAASGIASAASAARETVKMANTLLDVSRLEEGKMPMKKASTDVAKIAADVAHANTAMDRSRTIAVSGPAPVVAMCDAELIRRVIDNLVGNAVKHTPSGGTINVDVAHRDGRVRVAISDQGPGVPVQFRERIFEKFAAATKDSTYHSAGLGLAFCRLAIDAHGGTIGVEAGATKGSVFAFEIPV